MLALLTALYWIAVVVGLLGLCAFLSGRYFHLETEPHMVTFARTVDGWRLALRRYQPGEPVKDAPPLLLCPGLGMSGEVFDAGDVSLARYLSAQGYDVWVLDFRGRGRSSRPRLWGRYRPNWSFDEYLEFDLPAALAEIRGRTGASEVSWVGFGGGALAMLAVVAEREGPRLGRGVALAAPAYFRRQSEHISPWLVRLLRFVPSRALVALAAPLLGRVNLPPFRWLCHADNVDGTIYRRVMVTAFSGCAPKELDQLADWLERDVLTGFDDGRDYRKELARIELPVLLISGPRDRLAPPSMVQETFETLEHARDKQLVVAGRLGGMSANYGHLDLLIGRNAPRDVFPLIARWLERRAEEQPGASAASERPPAAGEVVPEVSSPAGASETGAATVQGAASDAPGLDPSSAQTARPEGVPF
ncbi:MAG: alpha/beta fold hydrolase [Deltaproteobacteria bacterium]|nr:alpha/beta fold hydrolase [Deltaproteobacteria bacterium]